MAHDQKQKSIPYGRCLTIVLQYFDIFLTDIKGNSYSKAMEIDSRTLNKMGYILTTDNAQVPKCQIGAHTDEEHDKEETQQIGDDNEFADMFEMSPLVSSSEDVDTTSQRLRMEGRIKYIEDEVHHIREYVCNIKDMMVSSLSHYPPP